MTQVISLVAPPQPKTKNKTMPKPKTMTPARSPMDLDEPQPQQHQQQQQQQQQNDRARAVRSAVAAAATTPDSSPSPRSASAGLARKRTASINTAEANYARLEQLRLNTPVAMSENSSRDLICLCTPAPKIPRPRNAFILYRQHHQAQVVQENPTLSNPEISKIIGEKWGEESEEIKNNWKGLADEEKQRHQQLYPDYRYQPRRGARAQAARGGASPADETGRCPKCHGRSIATPRTPSTPFGTPTAAKAGAAPPYQPGLGDEVEIARRHSYGVLPPNRLRYSQQPSQDLEDYDPESPEMKRRRFNSAGSYHTVSSPNPPHEAYPGRPPAQLMRNPANLVMRQYSNNPLPQLGGIPRSKSGPMPPPPRPSISGTWAEQDYRATRHGSFDESLRLPPLQTSVPMSPSVAAEVDIRQITTPVNGLGITTARDSQARSVEAMVMSIPFSRKLAVLSKISHPLAPPCPGSPALETRGAIIAVEGPKPRMLQQVGTAIEKALVASNEVSLRTWANHLIEDRRGSDASQSERGGTPFDQNSFMTYLQTMAIWHEKSHEIVQYITSRDLHSPVPSENEDMGVTSRRGSMDDMASPLPPERSAAARIPVALLKEGFSLTLSDKFASTTPINDSYTPVDHWQWMATLWRGVIGPDLVVYVKPSVEEEMAKFGTVEFQKRPSLIVVRIPVGKDLDEATERRVAFEVIEWMRGGSFRDGFGGV